MNVARLFLIGLAFLSAAPAQKYTGPKPPQPDIVYLVHADALVPTEAVEAKEEKRKNDLAYVVTGPNSSAKTPLASPQFVIESDKLAVEKLTLYRFEIKNGHREVFFAHNGKGSARSRRIEVTALGGGLSRITVEESLENGEYGLSPEGSNMVFCFQVY